MDPTAQNPSIQPVDDTQGATSAPVPTVPADQQQQSPVSVPVGGKEQEVVPIAEIQPTHPEIVVSKIVQEAGVEAMPSEEPQLTQEHKVLGVEVAKEATPVPSGPSIVQLPENYKAPRGFFGLFHQQVKSAATWLWLLLFKVQEQKENQSKK
jgi:hypothetical protein